VKILLLGKGGQVGWELQRSLSVVGELVALDRHSPEHCGDLSQLDGLRDTVRALRPALIVNAAAHTAVDKAESEPALPHIINAQAPGVLGEEAARLGALLLHYSTDYVFDGGGSQPWAETAPTGPLSVYGSSKLAGEQAIAASGCRHLILRTSWVYGARGGNFAKTMLRLAAERERLTVIDDQWGAPTSAELLADVSAHVARSTLLHPERAGLYHCVAAGETTWNSYARFVLAHAQSRGRSLKAGPDQVDRVPTSGFPTPARRPNNSRLDCSKLQSTFRLHLPPWQHGVARMLDEIL
jgi:dTDP-4-dehydrorhamnose reductase